MKSLECGSCTLGIGLRSKSKPLQSRDVWKQKGVTGVSTVASAKTRFSLMMKGSGKIEVSVSTVASALLYPTNEHMREIICQILVVRESVT